MKSQTGLLFALPALIVLFMLIAYPVAYTGLLSVTDANGKFSGLENFAAVLRPKVTVQAFINTIYWVFGSVMFQVVLGTLTAILLNQSFRARRAAGEHADPRGGAGDRCGDYLGVDVPYLDRDHQLHADRRGRDRKFGSLADQSGYGHAGADRH